MLKIERPAWSMPVVYNADNDPPVPRCPLPRGVITRLEGNVQYAEAEPILVMYRDFADATAKTGNGMWFADNGSFGCTGGAGSERWELWPPLCPQQIGTVLQPQPACCSNLCTCSSAAGTRTYIGPADDIPAASWVCTNSDITDTDNVNLTDFQVDVIEGNAANRTITNYSNCSLCGGSAINATAVCDYQGYEWLQGIYDDPVNPFPMYQHFFWDASSGSVAYAGLKPLAHTLVSVYHKEKWYKRCEAYDGGILSDECEQVTNWPCRVPEYWIYACAGVPVFSWELNEMLQAGKITSDEFSWFFESQYLNKPLGSTGIGKSLIAKLENTHWYHPDSSGIGILQLKDWRGITLPGESTPVSSSEDRIVRKDLARYSVTLVRTVVEHQFFHARPGGWTHCCYAPPKVCGTGGCGGDIYTPLEIEQQAPQIARATGCNIAGANCSNVVYDQIGQTPLNSQQSCFTAAPFPQCSTCVPSNSYRGCSVCGGCGSCNPPLTVGCGGTTPYACAQDVYRSQCDSIHFTFTSYYHDQTGNLDAEKCVHTNHAYLWAINEECIESDGVCVKTPCPPGPVEQTPRQNVHISSVLHSLARLCGCISNATFCSGARHTLSDSLTSPNWFCPGFVAKQPNNTNRDPGNPTKAPYTTDGCGQYLCNDTVAEPLGACCVTPDGQPSVCIDAVTEAQCIKCGEVAGYTSSWKGSNSCCLDSDLCG